MRHTGTIAARELRSLFVSPVAYVVLTLWSVIAGTFFLASLTQAQEDDPQDAIQVLPEAAQKCILPASPNAIPEEAVYDDLIGEVRDFLIAQ